MSRRLETYLDLRRRLARTEDRALMQLLMRADASPGLGCARVVEIGESRVFTKSLPLTREEHDRPFSTENLFELPAFYHYGVGSAGFGAFRELAAHTKTTQWVVRGEIDTFPLIYHHRVLPIGGEAFSMRDDELDEYVAYWDDNAQVRAYMQARREAEHHIVLFLEYVPHVLRTWLGANLDRLDMVTSGMKRTVEFLRERGLGHFDAHLGNILTDGRQVFLTDFGLAVDEEFSLDADERAFFAAHRHYDAGELITSLAWPARKIARAWDEETTRAVCARYGDTSLATLLDNLNALADARLLSLPDDYRATLARYRDVIVIMDRVFTALREGSKRDGGYDDEELGCALRRAGWSPTIANPSLAR